MSDIQRYNPKFESSGPFNSVVWVSSGEGVVCMYSDHIADRKADRETMRIQAGAISHLETGIKFLLSFAPDKPPKGLDPTFYHTGTYEGDLELWNRIDSIGAQEGSDHGN